MILSIHEIQGIYLEAPTQREGGNFGTTMIISTAQGPVTFFLISRAPGGLEIQPVENAQMAAVDATRARRTQQDNATLF